TVLALETHEEILEGLNGDDEPACFVRYDFLPIFRRGITRRSYHHLEILGAVRIRQDEELVACGFQVVDRAFLAGGNEGGSGRRITGGDEVAFAGLMVMQRDDDPVIQRAVIDAHEEAGFVVRSEEHTSELQSRENLVCRLL